MKFEQTYSNTVKTTVKTVDTDKLSDITALILEKSEDLMILCRNSGKQALIVVDSGLNKNSLDIFMSLRDSSGRPHSEAEYFELLDNLSEVILKPLTP